MSIRRVPRPFRFLAVTTLLSCAAMAQQAPAPAADPPSDEPRPSPVSRNVGGLTVSIDPATGRLVPPTTEQQRRLADALATLLDRRTDDLVIEQHPNGMRMVDLRGGFQNATLLRVMPDGTIALQCITDPEAAMMLPATTGSAGEDR